MTAIAGIWSFSGPTSAEAAAMSMLEHQLQYGPHGSEVARLGEAVFGRGLYRMLPEDRYDRQPLIDPTGRWMMVGDVRVDNRDEILERLGHRVGTEVADAELLFRGYCRWGDEVFDLIIGDFALGLLDARDETLTLVRDPAGQRPLHFHASDNFVAFASMPQGLHAHPNIPRQLARKEIAAFIANLPRESSSTFFEGLSRVPPGQLMRIRRGRVETRSYWRLPDHQIYYPKQSDYIEAFREQLDRATRARLRGAGSRVGAHLSAGLDSGAVASTAARIMAPAGEKVVAFTSAPREGFNGPSIPGRLGDESEIAAEVATRYPNMQHVIVRTGGASPLDTIGAHAELFQEPVGHPCNFVWWSAVHEEARSLGLSVMLTGEAGNLTISSGGLPMLTEFVRTRRWARWLREARSVAGASASWRGVLAMSFGPWVPAPLWRTLLSRFATSGGGRRPQLLHPSLFSELEPRAKAAAKSDPPNKEDRQTRWELLQQHEPGNFRKGVLAKWGIDERDPTADRRLAEFCLALPAEQLFSGGVTRRLARLALIDRLPDSVINGVRGYQYPDWYERLDKESLRRTLSELEAGSMASLLLDFHELRELVSRWPSGDQWGAIDNIATYRLDFLMALSAGAFANRVCQ
jgi:asparagine synthase (glutamine-hydrolysing)